LLATAHLRLIISLYDICMALKVKPNETQIQALAEFRYILRKFLRFSEEAAARSGLTAQQHQLLLQIDGAPADTLTTIGYLADRLSLRHHSVVELGDRSEEAGLLIRRRGPDDRRCVVLELTNAGARVLRDLSADHARELTELGPQLVQALKAIAS
jgi:DNA-binding MarR family transcriptional regulator